MNQASEKSKLNANRSGAVPPIDWHPFHIFSMLGSKVIPLKKMGSAECSPPFSSRSTSHFGAVPTPPVCPPHAGPKRPGAGYGFSLERSPGLTLAVSTIRARAGRCREGGLSSTDERVRGHATEGTQALSEVVHMVTVSSTRIVEMIGAYPKCSHFVTSDSY